MLRFRRVEIVAMFKKANIVIPLGGLLVAWFAYLMPATKYFSSIPGNLGDARFNSVVLEHDFHFLMGLEQSLWSPRYYYPFADALAFSDNHFGAFWAYAVFRVTGLAREYAFIAWFIVGNCLTYFSSYWVLRRMRLAALPATFGALIFTFSLAALHKEDHAQFVYRFTIPLAYYSFVMFAIERRPAHGAWACFWLAWTFYCSIYLGVFLSYLLFVAAAAIVVQNEFSFARWRRAILAEKRIALVRTALISLLCIVAVGALLLRYKTVAAIHGAERPFEEVAEMTPRLRSYLLADHSRIYKNLGKSIVLPMRHEHQMFVGFSVLLMLGWGLWHVRTQIWRWRLFRVSALSLLALVALTLRFDGFCLYDWLMKLPGVSSIRVVSRIIVVMLFPLACMAAVALQELLDKAKRPGQIHVLAGAAIAMILFAVEMATYKPLTAPIKDWQDRQQRLRAQLPSTISSANALLVLAEDEDVKRDGYLAYVLTEIDAMILAQDLGLVTVNGYSGYNPQNHHLPFPHSNPTDWTNHFSNDGMPGKRADTGSLRIEDLIVLSFGGCRSHPR